MNGINCGIFKVSCTTCCNCKYGFIVFPVDIFKSNIAEVFNRLRTVAPAINDKGIACVVAITFITAIQFSICNIGRIADVNGVVISTAACIAAVNVAFNSTAADVNCVVICTAAG